MRRDKELRWIIDRTRSVYGENITPTAKMRRDFLIARGGSLPVPAGSLPVPAGAADGRGSR